MYINYIGAVAMSEFVSNPIFYIENTKDIPISKSNTLIEAGFDLTLAEHDLMTLAINKLHKQGTGNHQVFITAQELAVANKISESHAYQQLKVTADKLMERHLKFPLYIDLDKNKTKNLMPFALFHPNMDAMKQYRQNTTGYKVSAMLIQAVLSIYIFPTQFDF